MSVMSQVLGRGGISTVVGEVAGIPPGRNTGIAPLVGIGIFRFRKVQTDVLK